MLVQLSYGHPLLYVWGRFRDLTAPLMPDEESFNGCKGGPEHNSNKGSHSPSDASLDMPGVLADQGCSQGWHRALCSPQAPGTACLLCMGYITWRLMGVVQ